MFEKYETKRIHYEEKDRIHLLKVNSDNTIGVNYNEKSNKTYTKEEMVSKLRDMFMDITMNKYDKGFSRWIEENL